MKYKFEALRCVLSEMWLFYAIGFVAIAIDVVTIFLSVAHKMTAWCIVINEQGEVGVAANRAPLVVSVVVLVVLIVIIGAQACIDKRYVEYLASRFEDQDEGRE